MSGKMPLRGSSHSRGGAKNWFLPPPRAERPGAFRDLPQTRLGRAPGGPFSGTRPRDPGNPEKTGNSGIFPPETARSAAPETLVGQTPRGTLLIDV